MEEIPEFEAHQVSVRGCSEDLIGLFRKFYLIIIKESLYDDYVAFRTTKWLLYWFIQVWRHT